MASETELLRLAVAAYEAASEPELWPVFLKGYTQAVAADFSVIQIHNIGQHISTVVSAFGLSSPMKREYNEYYSKQNIWRESGRARYAPGMVNLDHEMCPPEVAQKSEFYNDCMLRMGGAYTFGAVFASEDESRFPTVSAQRGRSKQRFGETERETAQFLLPHLGRAWTVYRRLDILAAGESVLETLPLGVAFLAGDGTAVYCNRAAEEIFRANDGLLLRRGKLSAADPIADVHLRRAVREALSPGAPLGPAAVQVPRTSLRRGYQIAAAPLRKRFRQFTGMLEPVAVALITDLEKQARANTDLLRQTYKLTRKETMLAAKLFEGKPVEQAARELAITYETARTHLRRIFSKTGTSRQAELLLLIARLPISTGGDG